MTEDLDDNQSTQSDNPPLQPSNGAARYAGNKGLTQAYEIRNMAAGAAMELKDIDANTIEQKYARAQALRALAFVWSEASERIRIIRGRPMPGSLRPERKAKVAKPVVVQPHETPE